MAKRTFLIVLDSLGIGAMPDAANWGDQGSNTLGVIRLHPDFHCPNLEKLKIFVLCVFEMRGFCRMELFRHSRAPFPYFLNVNANVGITKGADDEIVRV